MNSSPSSGSSADKPVVITDNLGEIRVLANIQPPKFRGVPFGDWPVYGDFPQTPMIPRSQWKPVSYNKYFPAVKDQDGIGACNAFDTVNIVQGCRNMAGLPDVDLSCGYLYGNINGQQDQGSMLEDALAWMVEHGTPPSSIVGDLSWKKSTWPANASKEAANYRVVQAYWCPTFDHLGSAIQSGFLCSVGIMWADGDNVDSDGWIPTNPRGSQGGHAIARGSLENRNGKWGLGGPNSWSPRWGVAGYMTIPENRFGSQVGGHWAVKVVSDFGGSDAPSPPSVP